MIKSLKEIPEGVTLTPRQKMDIHSYLLDKAYQKDYQGFREFLSSDVPEEHKQEILGNIFDTQKRDIGAGSFGISRRQEEVINNLYVPPSRIKTKQIPSNMPIIVSSDEARAKHQENLNFLKQREQMFSQIPSAESTPATVAPRGMPYNANTMRGVI